MLFAVRLCIGPGHLSGDDRIDPSARRDDQVYRRASLSLSADCLGEDNPLCRSAALLRRDCANVEASAPECGACLLLRHADDVGYGGLRSRVASWGAGPLWTFGTLGTCGGICSRWQEAQKRGVSQDTKVVQLN